MKDGRIKFAHIVSAPCISCGEEKPAEALNRELWCDDCRIAATRAAARWARIVALVGALGIAIWIAVSVMPTGGQFVIWAGIVLVTYRILGKLARELVFGVLRARRSRARR